jgi:galactose mutarotase-like enzyme
MFSVENQYIKAGFSSKGAELQTLFSKDLQLEYMWEGDPAYWGKHSPILFPIVGTLRNNTFHFDGKSYQMGRHGFARDMEFSVVGQHFEEITFQLKSDTWTLERYPFEFEFNIGYRLTDHQLLTTYQVRNTGNGNMYFSVGGHPAFRVPLVKGTVYEDYYLEFNEDETLPRWPISREGLIEKAAVGLLHETNLLPLTRELFYQDALVTKFPTSSIISLKSEKTDHGLDFHVGEFPYLGIWAAKNADFVCLEPWCGIADSVDADQQLVNKEGIVELPTGGVFERTWMIRVF